MNYVLLVGLILGCTVCLSDGAQASQSSLLSLLCEKNTEAISLVGGDVRKQSHKAKSQLAQSNCDTDKLNFCGRSCSIDYDGCLAGVAGAAFCQKQRTSCLKSCRTKHCK
jgi:hypothetical protein